MNILVINWQDITNPLGGGAEAHLHEIFKRVAARGHDVTLYCSMYDGAASEEILDGIRIIREGSRNMFNFRVYPRYKRDFRRRGFDIIIDDINKIPFYTPLFVREPLLAIAHHFFGTSIFLEAGPIAGSYVYFAEKLVDYVYKSTPFAVVSESTLEEYTSRGFDRKNFTIIPNCIDQDHLPLRIGQKATHPVVTYFGRLKKYKSPDHLLRAFAIAAHDAPQAELHVLGAGDFRPHLESLARELGIAQQTQFFGYVSEEVKIAELSAAHCVVNPSMKEGWGITNIEANACGAPVISADAPGLRDSVQDGVSGLLYEYGNIEALADCIRRVLNDVALRDRLSYGAVEWARRFDWETSAELMIERCREVIEAHHNKGPRSTV